MMVPKADFPRLVSSKAVAPEISIVRSESRRAGDRGARCSSSLS